MKHGSKRDLLALSQKLWHGERQEAKARAFRFDQDITDLNHKKQRQFEQLQLQGIRAQLDEAAWQDYEQVKGN